MYSTSRYPHRDFLDNAGDALYYDEGFRRVLEDHRVYLRTVGNVKRVTIQPGLAYRFEFNFYGLLKFHSVPQYLWWIIMRMLEMTSPDQMTRNLPLYFFPDESILTQIRGFHASLSTS
jgi:hypothetical protein